MAITFYSSIDSDTSVLSFDLDDTLYENNDVIIKAEQAQYDALCQLVPEAKAQGIRHWYQLKTAVGKQHPECRHDVSQWRRLVIQQGLAQLGVTDEQIAAQVFDAFYQARSNLAITEQTFDVLAQLKSQYILIAVTNGNVDIDRVGLTPYFSGYYRAGEQGCRMKPYPDMLIKAVSDLGLEKPQHIIHLGDNVGSDVRAAQRAGVSSFWYNPKQKAYPKGDALPTAQYQNITDLLQLLK